MTEQEVFLRLHEIPGSDSEKLSQFAEEISRQCSAPSRIALDSWLNSPQSRGIPCATVCTELKELAVGELMQRAGSVEPGLRVHFMQIVVAQQLAFRELLLTVLEPLLKDRHAAGETRICDAAYALVRKLVTVDAGEASKFRSESEFLALDPNERSNEIKEWIESKAWTEIFPVPLG
jgi:hypothetical protein